MDMLKGILFDYGHTLVHFSDIEKTHLTAIKNVQRILQRLGVSVSVSAIRTIVEDFADRRDSAVVSMEEEFTDILRRLELKSFSQYDLQEVINAYWRPYVQHARAREGVVELLRYLKRMSFKLGIVANIWSGGMNPVLERLDLSRFFDATVASVDVGFKKPDPRIFQLALECLTLRSDEVIFVGDDPETDIDAAHNLGIITVRLMRGPNRTRPDVVKPDYRISNLSELVPIVGT